VSVSVLGIRHHGPGSARSVERALVELRPDAVLIEGPPEAEPLLALAADPEMRPPVALLGYVADDPGRAVFYPFAEFSPEWQAIRHALAEQITLRMIDLPLRTVLAEPRDHASPLRDRDPIARLADAAGHGDPERFWEDVVEHRGGEQAFVAIAEAMAALREIEDGPPVGGHDERPAQVHEARREAHMRQAIRQALKDGHERIVVICGAWHAPALGSLTGAGADAALLRGLPRRKVALTWVPWTYDRLSARSGYGAGVSSPGWYDHLFRCRDEEVVVRWLARTAELLRTEDIPISSAHVIEAVRLAEALATLRDRPLAGLPELIEATRAVIGEGAPSALALVHERLVVGQVLGQVPEAAPMAPLQADLDREQRRLRLRTTAGARTVDLDLRTDLDRDRSRLLHRLVLLDVPWGEPRRARGARGTFHELWQLQWQPEYAVRLIEASRYGATLADAATGLVRERAAAGGGLLVLTGLVERALLADLPLAVAAAMAAFEERAAVGADATQLMETLPPLVRVLRYGNVRATDASHVAHIVEGLVARIVVGLPLAARSLDDDAASDLAARIDAVDSALSLLDRDELRDRWRAVLERLADRDDLHGRVTGRCTRILHDSDVLELGELERRVGAALSTGNDPAIGSAWIEGFLGQSGLVLLHDETLLRLVDRWLADVGEAALTQVLPVLRRTFSTFPSGERRRIGERVRQLGGPSRASSASALDATIDRERAELVLPILQLILGAERTAT
jgi:hypothetical protein